MFSVALIGPDGAGKTTICRNLLNRLPVPVKYLYMGVNAGASNFMLPTTRLARAARQLLGIAPDQGGPREHSNAPNPPRSAVRRCVASVRNGLSLVNRLAEEWFRQCLAWYYKSRGCVVLFDRHYFVDYYAYDIAPACRNRPLARRIHGFMLRQVYPRPELVICLDAPADVLFARKREGTIALLERRRSEYLEIRDHVPHFVVVDVNRSLEVVTQEVLQVVVSYYEKLRRERTSQRLNGTYMEDSPRFNAEGRGSRCREQASEASNGGKSIDPSLDAAAFHAELAVLEMAAHSERLHVDA